MAPKRITQAFATADDTADVLGVSRARTRQLVTLARKTMSAGTGAARSSAVVKFKSNATKARHTTRKRAK